MSESERAARYLQRAEELRTVAESLKDEQAKALILATADEYVLLAQSVAARTSGKPPDPKRI